VPITRSQIAFVFGLCGGDGEEEIAGNDPLRVQAQEGRPAQVASRSAPRTPWQVLTHRSWSLHIDRDAEESLTSPWVKIIYNIFDILLDL
jgi:hypothetical protein